MKITENASAAFFWRSGGLSGAADLLPVVAEEALVNDLDPGAGDMIAVTGQIRSHNRRENGVRRLMIFVFAAQVNVESGEAINDLDLTGILCREPVYRRTPWAGRFAT